MGRRLKGLALAAVTVLSLLVSLAVIEIGLRAAGFRPWMSVVDSRGEPTMHDPDPQLGWWLRPGHWQYGPLAPGGTTIEVTIGPDRSRRTRPAVEAEPTRPQVVILGGSYTFGWSVSDHETWPWRLQMLRPEVDVRNYGTGGYGTLQMLILLERMLAAGRRPTHVIYAFDDDHLGRNVLWGPWHKALALMSRQTIIAAPYGALDAESRLVRHPPESYPLWPLREHSATVALLQDRWFMMRARKLGADAREVTRQVLALMADRCRTSGIRFSMVLLKVNSYSHDAVVPFARAHGIEVIDCNQTMTKEDAVLGDFHPNAQFLARWGECLARGMRDPHVAADAG